MASVNPKELTKEQLADYFVCLDCSYLALISTFPKTAPESDPDWEYACPSPDCADDGGDLINASNARWCTDKDCQTLAEPDGICCPYHGSERYAREYYEGVDRVEQGLADDDDTLIPSDSDLIEQQLYE